MATTSYVIKSIITQYEELHKGSPWIGRSVDRTLDQLKADSLFQIPYGLKTSIAQQLAHLRFWRVEAVERMRTGKASKNDSDPDNWPDNNSLQALGIDQNLQAHRESVLEFLGMLETRNDQFLMETYFDSDFKKQFTYHKLITGIVHHDVYHLAQIRIILRLLAQDVSSR